MVSNMIRKNLFDIKTPETTEEFRDNLKKYFITHWFNIVDYQKLGHLEFTQPFEMDVLNLQVWGKSLKWDDGKSRTKKSIYVNLNEVSNLNDILDKGILYLTPTIDFNKYREDGTLEVVELKTNTNVNDFLNNITPEWTPIFSKENRTIYKYLLNATSSNFEKAEKLAYSLLNEEERGVLPQ